MAVGVVTNLGQGVSVICDITKGQGALDEIIAFDNFEILCFFVFFLQFSIFYSVLIVLCSNYS